MDEYQSNYTDIINFEKEYDQEVSFFLGASNKPLSLLQDNPEGEEAASDTSQQQKKPLRRQCNTEDAESALDREELPVYLVTVTAASNPNIAEISGDEEEEAGPRSPEKIIFSFDQTERMFREEFLSPDILDRAETLGSQSPLPADGSGGVSPACAPLTPSSAVGLGNLDNLVRMMEVLSVLKEENKTLKRKCAYLDDTRALLQVQNDMLLTKETNGTRYQQKMRVMDYLNKSSPIEKLDRGPSEKRVAHKSRRRSRHQRGTSESSDTGEAALNNQKAAGHEPLKFHQRSQSVGSIEMVDLDMNTMTVQEQVYRSKSAEKSSKHQFSRAAKTSKKFQAKWERVKKVFAGKPEPGASRDSAAISAEQLVKVNSRLKQRHKPPNLPHVQSECFMSGMDRLKPGDARLCQSSLQLVDPPSPSSVQSEPPQRIEEFMDEATQANKITTSHSASNLAPLTRSHSLSSCSSMEGAEVKAVLANETKKSRKSSCSPYLTVQAMPRRKSSPTLSLRDQSELKRFNQSLFADGDGRLERNDSHLRRSSSYKDRSQNKPSDGEGERPSPIKAAGKDTARKARAAWVRVKDIIHTRKDSLKRRSHRAMSAGDGLLEGYERDISPGSPKGSPSDSEIAYNRRTSPLGRGTSPDSPRVSRKSKSKTAPRRMRKSLQKAKSTSPSPPEQRKRQSLANVALSGATPDEMAAILGVSDDFTKKMAEWEAKKKGQFVKANSFSYEEMSRHQIDGKETTQFSEEFIKKMEQWEQMKGLSTCSSPRQRGSVCMRDGTQSPDNRMGGVTPPPQLESSASYEEILSESFSKTVQEWERVKEQRAKSTGSPTPTEGRKTPYRASRKDERSKSRERDRSRHKYEKEIIKIEKKEKFIEVERQKLEKMKMRLDTNLESSSSSQDSQGLSQGFMKKLHEWEVMKGFKEEDVQETSGYASLKGMAFRDRIFPDGALQSLAAPASPTAVEPPHTPLSGQSSRSNGGSPDLRGTRAPVLRQESFQPARMLVDDSTSVDLSLIMGSTTSLEEKNCNLIQELQRREEDISLLESEINSLMNTIDAIKQDHHHDIDDYRRELWATSKLGKYTIESDLMAACLHDLGTQIHQLEEYGNRVAAEKHSLEVRQLEEAHIRSQVEARLLEEIEKLQLALDKKASVGHLGTDVFHRLYNYVRRVQAQITQLKISVQERNRLIAELERHLLVQEVTNKLLAANMERRKVELAYFQESRRKGTLKRWRTFNGADIRIRHDGTMDLISADSQPYTGVQTSYRDLQKSILRLTHEDVDSLMLHFDWLEGLKCEVERDVDSKPTQPQQQEPDGDFRSDLTNTTAQTVMTLCNCDYIPVNGGTPTHAEKLLDSRGIQTSLGDLSAAGVDARRVNKQLFSEPSSPCDIVRTSSFKERKRKSTERALEAGSGVAVRERGAGGGTDSEEKKARRISYSEWLQREPKPMEVNDDIMMITSSVVDRPPATSHTDSTTVGVQSTTLHSTPKRQKSCEEEDEGDGGLVREAGEPFNKPPQLPHSPIIRSKNPRKIKAAVQHIYADSRTWKATPPRRMVRHRRGDRAGEAGDTEARTAPASPDLSDPTTLTVRDRTRSDGASRARDHSPNSAFTRPARPLLTVGARPESRPLGVRDIVSKYENSSNGTGAASTGTSGALLRKTPSPIPVSPVRGLKSAAELMRESGERRRRSTSHDPGSSRSSLHVRPVSTGSSDKENDKSDGRPSASPEPRRSVGTVGKEKSLLKERINNKQRQTFLEEGRTSSTATRLSVKDGERPAEGGEVWQRDSSRSAKGVSGSPRHRKLRVSEGRPSPTQSEKSRHRLSGGSQGEEGAAGGSWFSRSHHGLFKKSATSPRSSSGATQRSGAISSLCMQAMSVSVDDPDGPPDTPPAAPRHSHASEGSAASASTSATSSAATTPERKKGKGRFLDGNWLQKPKRFFKVSKSSLWGNRSDANVLTKRKAKSSEDVTRCEHVIPTPPRTPPPRSTYDAAKEREEADDSDYESIVVLKHESLSSGGSSTNRKALPDLPVSGILKHPTGSKESSLLYDTVADCLSGGARETVIEGPPDPEAVYENIIVHDPADPLSEHVGEPKKASLATEKTGGEDPVYQSIEHTTLIELKETRIGGDESLTTAQMK